MKIINLVVLGVLIVISLVGTFYKQISFGLGLADIMGYIVLYFGTVIHLILTIILRNKGIYIHSLLVTIFTTFTMVIALKASIWRGPENKWNGRIFDSPCLTKIKIENQDTQTELRIQMCSMEYFSKLNGVWDGQKIQIKDGEILIPDGLYKYLQRPILSVVIEPDYWEKFENDKISKEFQFLKDTLKPIKIYNLEGEIVAIRNKKPIMKVAISGASR